MTNHYHLLIETIDPTLSLGMRQLNGVYTQRFNRCHSRVGHVFQGRFKAILVEKESYLLELCRYIVLNPVAAGIVQHPSQYPWSSYWGTVDAKTKPDFLHSDWIIGQFSSRKNEAIRQYCSFVEDGITGGTIPWMKLAGQCILGSEQFIARTEILIDEKRGVKEISRCQRQPGRPMLQEIFAEETLNNKLKRNEIIRNAHFLYGYKLKEIGDHLGIHYSTVSRVVNTK